MGLLDLFRPKKQEVTATRSALEEARDPGADRGAITGFVQKVLTLGIDGRGPYAGAAAVADKALKAEHGDERKAVARIVSAHVRSGAAGGFVTSLGGFFTMPVAIPANVLEFYVQATRMVAAVAKVRGYDLADPHVRTAVLLTLVGANADDVLSKAGVPATAIGGPKVLALLVGRLPRAALMVINKAVGFRLMRNVGERALARLGKGIPLAGGVIGGGLDGWMMKRIGDAARHEFPPVSAPALP